MYNLHVHANPLTHIFILATVSCCDSIKSKSDSSDSTRRRNSDSTSLNYLIASPLEPLLYYIIYDHQDSGFKDQ